MLVKLNACVFEFLRLVVVVCLITIDSDLESVRFEHRNFLA